MDDPVKSLIARRTRAVRYAFIKAAHIYVYVEQTSAMMLGTISEQIKIQLANARPNAREARQLAKEANHPEWASAAMFWYQELCALDTEVEARIAGTWQAETVKAAEAEYQLFG